MRAVVHAVDRVVAAESDCAIGSRHCLPVPLLGPPHGSTAHRLGVIEKRPPARARAQHLLNTLRMITIRKRRLDQPDKAVDDSAPLDLTRVATIAYSSEDTWCI